MDRERRGLVAITSLAPSSAASIGEVFGMTKWDEKALANALMDLAEYGRIYLDNLDDAYTVASNVIGIVIKIYPVYGRYCLELVEECGKRGIDIQQISKGCMQFYEPS